jgi:hypothetical protein
MLLALKMEEDEPAIHVAANSGKSKKMYSP